MLAQKDIQATVQKLKLDIFIKSFLISHHCVQLIAADLQKSVTVLVN